MFEQTFTFHAYAGARGYGKTSAAREAYDRFPRRDWGGCAFADREPIFGGVIADPIEITAHDVETAAREDLEALASAAWLPGVTTQTVLDTFGRRVVRVSSTPCVTTLPARAR